MDGDENNINLLPDSLKEEEAKSQAAKNGATPVKFHFPREQAKPAALPSPIAATLPLQETAKKPAPASQVKQSQPKVKVGTKPGFFRRLFGGLKIKKAVSQKGKPAKPSGFVEPDISSFPSIREENNTAKIKDLSAQKNQMPDLLETGEMDVNLIPAGIYLLPDKKIFASLARIALTGALAILLVYVSLVIYQQYIKSQNEKLIQELAAGEVITQKYQSLEAEAGQLSGKLESIQVLLDRHVYWTKVFSALERLTIEDVYFKNISVSTNGSITLSAVAPNYTAVARQYLALEQSPDIIESVKISSASGEAETGQVNFNITLKLMPNFIFAAKP